MKEEVSFIMFRIKLISFENSSNINSLDQNQITPVHYEFTVTSRENMYTYLDINIDSYTFGKIQSKISVWLQFIIVE